MDCHWFLTLVTLITNRCCLGYLRLLHYTEHAVYPADVAELTRVVIQHQVALVQSEILLSPTEEEQEEEDGVLYRLKGESCYRLHVSPYSVMIGGVQCVTGAAEGSSCLEQIIIGIPV